MGYRTDLCLAADWLCDIQRADGGWGLAPGQESSIVNTAEAVIVLHRDGRHAANARRGVEYIKTRLFDHLRDRGPRVRYVAFALFAARTYPEWATQDFIGRCCEWLESARNSDHGWPTERTTGSASDLFPTCLVITALRHAEYSENKLEPSLTWVISRAADTGWGFSNTGTPSPVATAIAVTALAGTSYDSHHKMVAARDLLLQTSHWGFEEEVIAGTVWKHCTYAVVLPALMLLGAVPYSPVVAEAARYINQHRASNGGWTEASGHDGRTIRAQYWAVMAFGAVEDAFDPAIHVLRIDAERAQETLQEPDFVKISVRSRWATILPAAVYRGATYFLLVVSVAFLAGVHRLVIKLPTRVDAVSAGLALVAAWWLIDKRPKQFPRLTRIARIVLALLALLGVLLGTSVEGALATIQNTFVRLGWR